MATLMDRELDRRHATCGVTSIAGRRAAFSLQPKLTGPAMSLGFFWLPPGCGLSCRGRPPQQGGVVIAKTPGATLHRRPFMAPAVRRARVPEPPPRRIVSKQRHFRAPDHPPAPLLLFPQCHLLGYKIDCHQQLATFLFELPGAGAPGFFATSPTAWHRRPSPAAPATAPLSPAPLWPAAPRAD